VITDTTPCGWFGKLPALGDFGSRRLPADMVARCDAWLSAGLAASQHQLGPQWLDTYLNAPIWRFAWAPGLAGPDGWIGVLMPSVDRVGRYFPLLVAAPCPLERLAGLDLDATDAWLDRIAAIAHGSLDATARIDDLEAALQATPLPGAPAVTDAGGASGSMRAGAAPGTPLRTLVHRLAGLSLLMPTPDQPHSLWWSGTAPDWPSSLRRTPGLPTADDFTALLDGRC
jgi:type VI secretion system protein ImpM